MNEYVDVDIIENGKVIGTTKILRKTEEPEEQKIKLEKVDDKAAYRNLLIKYAELEADNRLLEQRGSDILKELLDKNKKCIELERQIEKMKCCQNCKHCAKIHDYDLDNEEDDNIEFCEVRCHERSGWELKEIEK